MSASDVFTTTYLPLITFIGGAGVTITLEAIREFNKRKRVTTARAAERLAKVVKRRETFEIGSLRAAYFALTRLARAATQYHLLDRAAAESTNSPYGSHRVTDQPGGSEIDEELRVANGEASWSIAIVDDARI
jgi:hypothetical protein